MSGFDWAARRGMIEAGGKRLEAAAWGPPPDAATTLVLLHEGLGCVALWRDFPERLAEATGLGVLAYSRAGYGQSDPVELPRPLDYMTREAMGSLPEVLDAAGVRRAILVGHSDGATIAAIYAGSAFDPRVRGIALMAPHFFTEDMGLAEIAKAKTAFADTDMRARMAKYHRDPDNAFHGWNGAWLDPGFREWSVADVIDYIRVPVLAIQGAADQYGTLAQIREIEDRCYAPVDVAVLDDCRHSPHLDQPETTLAHLAEFCARLERIEHEEVQVA
ncbi:alpha/beta fold hydrolase [Rhodobacterales bacterium HKCCE2091]|nr:alpha/beta fold hydrolase [Rhodobacterales bacterium HKCCE2091]